VIRVPLADAALALDAEPAAVFGQGYPRAVRVDRQAERSTKWHDLLRLHIEIFREGPEFEGRLGRPGDRNCIRETVRSPERGRGRAVIYAEKRRRQPQAALGDIVQLTRIRRQVAEGKDVAIRARCHAERALVVQGIAQARLMSYLPGPVVRGDRHE